MSTRAELLDFGDDEAAENTHAPKPAKVKVGSHVKSVERDIVILSVKADVHKASRQPGLKIEIQSDSGKVYKVRLFDRDFVSSCSCASWIFLNAKKARALNLPTGQRPHCVHIRTLKSQLTSDQILGRSYAEHVVQQRFSLIELED